MSQKIESERRLLKNTQAEFERAIYSGKNESGLRPIGTSVLILVDQVSATSSGEAGAALLKEAGITPVPGTKEGLVGIGLTADQIAKMNVAAESGAIILVGAAAFRYYDDGSPWTDYKPQPGDRVYFERYAGRELLGQDGLTYRMMTYTCIAGIEEPEKVSKIARETRKSAKKRK